MNKFVRFLPIADAFAAMSKYPRTKVGALVLGPRFEVRSTGWNGAPRGSRADEDDRLAKIGKHQKPNVGGELMLAARAEA